MMGALLPRLVLLSAAGFLVLSTPLLAGLGGAGGWSVGLFAVIFAARYMLTTDPAEWASPVVPAVAAGVNAAVAGLLWLLGRWLSGATGWAPGWGALPPILLALAGTALSVQLWSARRDAALSGMVRDAAALNAEAKALARAASGPDPDPEALDRIADRLNDRADDIRRDVTRLGRDDEPPR